MTKIDNLRGKHKQFVYQDFHTSVKQQDLQITFSFLLTPSIVFRPQLTIKNGAAGFSRVDRLLFDNLVFHLGLIESLSYWKAACSPEIKIQAGYLSSEQKEWWLNLLRKGMGEFFFQNKIDFRSNQFVNISSSGSKKFNPISLSSTAAQSLVLVGGGKDSAVSIEVLKQLKEQPAAMIVNPTLASEQIVKVAGLKQTIIINREIDSQLLTLNQSGYLNGHTPFSAYLGFLSLLVGSLFGFKNIIASNERSADEANICYLGQAINHQYSKSWEFEQLFRGYVDEYISPSFNYFSLMRPLWEIQISKLFAQFPQYFSSFRSCNRGQKDNSWCGRCPKCLSVYLLLLPFLKEKTAIIFGKDLLADPAVKPILTALTDENQIKPFECVGTREEIKASLENRTQKILADWGEDKFLNELQKTLLKKLTYA